MLDYKMKIDFEDGRWFQVEVVPDGSGSYRLEFSVSDNPLTVNLDERQKILGAAQGAVNTIRTYVG